MNVDIESVSKECYECSKFAIFPAKSLSTWPDPHYIWSRLHMDFAGPFLNKKWLLILDSKSKFADIQDMGDSTNATSTINALEDCFTKYGYCDFAVTDNGPPFSSREFQEYLKERNIQHISIAPYHPSSNGLAERLVRSFKDSMKKLVDEGNTPKEALQIFLKNYNYTIHSSTSKIPAEEMFGRNIKNDLAKIHPRNLIEVEHSKFKINEHIWIRLRKSDKWSPAVVTSVVSNKTYNVCANGRHLKVHQDQIRTSNGSQKSSPQLLDWNLGESTENDGPQHLAREPQQLISERPVRDRRPPDRLAY
jgi:hypothetical protein